MTTHLSLLKPHLELLLKSDPNFQSLWFSFDETRRRAFVNTVVNLERTCSDSQLGREFSNANDIARRRLVTVQQRDFQHSRLPKDWPLFIMDDVRRSSLYDSALESLGGLVSSIEQNVDIRLYGGLKVLKSIDPERLKAKSESRIQRILDDTWDAVRFRIVVGSLDQLEAVALQIWRQWIDAVLRCRNYYFFPKAGSEQHPYRAIHFQVLDVSGYPYEVQIMTLNAEVTSHLEHACFKQRVLPPTIEHREWLERTLLKALVRDVATAKW